MQLLSNEDIGFRHHWREHSRRGGFYRQYGEDWQELCDRELPHIAESL